MKNYGTNPNKKCAQTKQKVKAWILEFKTERHHRFIMDIKRGVRSDYYKSLDEKARLRYESKLQFAALKDDPYAMKKKDFNVSKYIASWPTISCADIYAYLIDYPSMYTKKNLKAYKSLESYKYVTRVVCYQISKLLEKGEFLILMETLMETFMLGK